MKDGHLDGVTPGTMVSCHPNWWKQAERFVELMNQCVKGTKQHPLP
jgi:hypothetical protein